MVARNLFNAPTEQTYGCGYLAAVWAANYPFQAGWIQLWASQTKGADLSGEPLGIVASAAVMANSKLHVPISPIEPKVHFESTKLVEA